MKNWVTPKSLDKPWPNQAPLRLEGVWVERGARTILRDLNLSFDPSQRYVIVGASGSGKSTLIRLLNRLDDPDAGRVMLGDVALTHLPVLTVRRRIGLVPQSPRPLPGSLGDNLRYPHDIHKLPRPDRTHLLAALGAVGLDPAALDRDAAELSGGERQRLALAVALELTPEILVLDEPTAALDPGAARRVAQRLEQVCWETGLRTIIVTHDRGFAPHLGDQGVRIDGGSVVDQGPIAEVLHRADQAEIDG